MKKGKNFLIWLCFAGANLFSLIGFYLSFHGNRPTGHAFLYTSLLFLIGFWYVSVHEIIKSQKISKADKFMWPVLIVVLSTFGQIAYLVRRNKQI
jgi:hypothetical protein